MKEQAIFTYWNESDGLIHHRKLLYDQRQAIKVALEHFTVSDIQEAISNYSSLLIDDKYFWTYRWTLTEFLSRRDGRKATDPYKWWQFLKNNFRAEKYLMIQPDKKKIRLFPIPGTVCYKKGCNLPGVSKKPGGEYDSYACGSHMSDEVKEIYE